MNDNRKTKQQLIKELETLRRQIAAIRKYGKLGKKVQGNKSAGELCTVKIPEEFRQIFLKAQDYVKQYFDQRIETPEYGTIEISGERYILVRAASMSTEFFDLVLSLYKDRGEDQARKVATDFLFDIAHTLGKADAREFHQKMTVTDPIEKLSAGPIHFAYSGWAFVDIFPESNPTPDDNYFLIYDHPFSFEAEEWIKHDRRTEFPVCIMNAGYSSGWCEESFGFPLVSVEVECRAKGDDYCRFIMAPPSKIDQYLENYGEHIPVKTARTQMFDIPEYFQRKRLEDALKKSHNELEMRVEQRTRELMKSNEQLLHQIEERIRAEKNLNAEKERLATTLRSIADGVIATDMRNKIILMNNVAGSLTEWDPDEATGQSLAKIYHIIDEKTGKQYRDPITKVMKKTPSPGLPGRTVLIARDGTKRIIADSGAPIRDKDNNIIGHVLVFRDITEKLKMEQEILKGQKLESLGLLAGGIAHDFNNILTSILGNISLAKLLVSKNDKISGILKEAENASLQARGLTQQLLTFSRGGTPIKETLSIDQLLGETTRFVLRGSNIAVRFSIDPELWAAEIDQSQISQVISNLVINAKQAMPDGGTIEVSAVNKKVGKNLSLPIKNGKYVLISITDHGTGIPEENLAKIYDPYFTTKVSGNGLGLAVSYSIIKNHGGYISVKSTVGKGSCFSLYLPASRQQPVMPEKTKKIPTATVKGKILLMDDEEDIRTIVKSLLQKLGHTVAAAANGEECIKLYKQALKTKKPFDALIMDLTILNGMGGNEALQKLKQIDPGVKAIASSGYSNDPVMADHKKYGFRGVLAKPYKITELNDSLARLLKPRKPRGKM